MVIGFIGAERINARLFYLIYGMTKKWAFISVVYIAGLSLLFYSIIYLDGTLQMAGMLSSVFLFIAYSRLRINYKKQAE